MARAKEFDPGAVVELAPERYRQRGYEATSASDPTEHLATARTPAGSATYASSSRRHHNTTWRPPTRAGESTRPGPDLLATP